jgi:hypothetical protein
MSMGISGRAGALALILLAAAALTAAAGAAEPAPKVVARSDRSPDPGGNFTLTFTVTSYRTANYTVLVSPRPEFAFADLSNGSQTMLVQNGTSADFNFEMQVTRSAQQGTYAMSYSVLRENATVKMSTVDVRVGALGSCSSFVVMVPIAGLALGLAWARRPGR